MTDAGEARGIERLLAIMARLRDPERGCPWDLEQGFESVAPYTIEEAYEVDDAIRRRDWDGLRDELGDLLLQVVFHAQIAREERRFDFEAVTDAICEKLVRRHPHVFGNARVESADAQTEAWERHKSRERAAGGDTHPLDGIALGLPALLRARKLISRASRAGLLEPDLAGSADAVAASLDALRTEAGGAAPDAARRTLGELLLAVVALASRLGLEPEDALRDAAAAFETEIRGRETGAPASPRTR